MIPARQVEGVRRPDLASARLAASDSQSFPALIFEWGDIVKYKKSAIKEITDEISSIDHVIDLVSLTVESTPNPQKQFCTFSILHFYCVLCLISSQAKYGWLMRIRNLEPHNEVKMNS